MINYSLVHSRSLFKLEKSTDAFLFVFKSSDWHWIEIALYTFLGLLLNFLWDITIGCLSIFDLVLIFRQLFFIRDCVIFVPHHSRAWTGTNLKKLEEDVFRKLTPSFQFISKFFIFLKLLSILLDSLNGSKFGLDTQYFQVWFLSLVLLLSLFSNIAVPFNNFSV